MRKKTHQKKQNTLHFSTLNIWDLGKNKGRVSTYLPLKGLVENNFNVIYISDHKAVENELYDGIAVRKNKLSIRPLRIKGLTVLSRMLFFPLTIISFFIYGCYYSFKYKPVAIYSHVSETAIPAFLISRIFNAKYILRLYGVDYKKNFSLLKKIKSFDLVLALNIKADAYILTNDGTEADKVVLGFGVDKSKIFFLKNGVTVIPELESNKTDESLAKNRIKTICSVSRLCDWKQVDLIIKALPKVIEKNKKVKLIIIGDGIERKPLENLSERLGVRKYVDFLGALEQNEVISILKDIDIFVSMNNLSSLTNPVYEAMLCAKPVIALNRGATETLIKNDNTGVLVERVDNNDLSTAINDLLSNDQKCITIGNNGKSFLIKNWPTWEERINAEVNIIKELTCNIK